VKQKNQEEWNSTPSKRKDAMPWSSRPDISKESNATMIAMFRRDPSTLVTWSSDESKMKTAYTSFELKMGRTVHSIKSNQTRILPPANRRWRRSTELMEY